MLAVTRLFHCEYLMEPEVKWFGPLFPNSTSFPFKHRNHSWCLLGAYSSGMYRISLKKAVVLNTLYFILFCLEVDTFIALTMWSQLMKAVEKMAYFGMLHDLCQHLSSKKFLLWFVSLAGWYPISSEISQTLFRLLKWPMYFFAFLSKAVVS